LRTSIRSSVLLGCILAVVTLASCSSFKYRDIQNNFIAAVAADNVQAVDSLGALTSSDAQQRYDEIQAQLSDAEIEKLDERLRPNAYAIRAVSQWRSGKLKEARASALKGQALPNVASSPRDQLVLVMIPALVIDAELVTKFKAAGGQVSEAEYNATYPDDFNTAAGVLANAVSAVQPGTPESVIYYVHLQRWRVLQNWRVVISRIEPDAANGAEARNRARADAQQRLGQDLVAEIASEENAVPDDHPLRKAMNAMKNNRVH
jgi:hypothetical protein